MDTHTPERKRVIRGFVFCCNDMTEVNMLDSVSVEVKATISNADFSRLVIFS